MPQEINFTQFSGIVNKKMSGMKMNEAQQSYVNSQLSSIFTQGDANKNEMLSKTELNNVLGMLNQVMDLAQTEPLSDTKDTPKEIKNPKFKGLENYKFEQHGAKDGVGTITVNGEKMIISTDGKEYSLIRSNSEDGALTSDNYSYSSMEELKVALEDKNNNFGSYSGIKDINDYFIP